MVSFVFEVSDAGDEPLGKESRDGVAGAERRVDIERGGGRVRQRFAPSPTGR
jgi:hypothetical protein